MCVFSYWIYQKSRVIRSHIHNWWQRKEWLHSCCKPNYTQSIDIEFSFISSNRLFCFLSSHCTAFPFNNPSQLHTDLFLCPSPCFLPLKTFFVCASVLNCYSYVLVFLDCSFCFYLGCGSKFFCKFKKRDIRKTTLDSEEFLFFYSFSVK